MDYNAKITIWTLVLLVGLLSLFTTVVTYRQIGQAGPRGPRGLVGISEVGATGATGASGLSVTGPRGPSGVPGYNIIGATGATGASGVSVTGPTGPSGAVGGVLIQTHTIACGTTGFPSVSSMKYSLDGLSWSDCIQSFSVKANTVGYGKGKWIAVGGDAPGDTILSSVDGITFTADVTGSFTTEGLCVIYANDLWIVGGTDSTASNTIKFSFDNGKTFLNSSGATFTSCYSIAYSGSRFIAVGTGPDPVMTSTDGTTWTSVGLTYDLGSPTQAYDVHWDGYYFEIVCGADGLSYSSQDGLTWYKDPTLNNGAALITSITSNGAGVWVAAGTDGGGPIYRYYDILTNTWYDSTISSPHTQFTTYGLVWNGSYFLAFANSTNDSGYTMLASSDGGQTFSDVGFTGVSSCSWTNGGTNNFWSRLPSSPEEALLMLAEQASSTNNYTLV